MALKIEQEGAVDNGMCLRHLSHLEWVLGCQRRGLAQS